jgi:uncharacterized protein YcbX
MAPGEAWAGVTIPVVRTVSRLSLAPVKAMALQHPDELMLEPFGVAENRRFYVLDDRGRRYGQIRNGTLVRIVPHYDATANRLTLRFPDGSIAAGEVRLGEPVVTDFTGRSVAGQRVEGPWSDAISAYAGRPLSLIKTDDPGAGVDRARGSVTMLSDASLELLARQAGRAGVDGRRFRMLIGIAGCAPHEEDGWLGRNVRVGDAIVRLHAQVGRCAITTQSPDSGVVDFDTLREIKGYRGLRAGKAIDFGVFGEVEQPGRVRLGDLVEPQ